MNIQLRYWHSKVIQARHFLYKRGDILDRNGNVLAQAVKVYNLVIDSKVFLATKNILNQQ